MRQPISAVDGVRLDAHKKLPIARATVTDDAAKTSLGWDRFVRLKAAAGVIDTGAKGTILDAGGYDGALALFLPDLNVDVIDPATTGGSILNIPVDNGFYQTVAAVDVLEHIVPSQRNDALKELARVSCSRLVLNYPCDGSIKAQELVFQLTGNQFIREHVQWPLPDSARILGELRALGFVGKIIPHTSIAVWAGQFIVQNLLPDVAVEFNRFLVSNYTDKFGDDFLYHLICAERLP